MLLFTATPHGGDQIGCLQLIVMLRYPLPRHGHVFAQFVECAPVMGVQQVKQLAPAGICQSFEKRVCVVVLCHF
jgi:hypothetical protein